MKFDKSFMERLVYGRFPQITEFEIDHMANNVQPVQFPDSEKLCHPPIARWRIGSTRFCYVPRVNFQKCSPGRLGAFLGARSWYEVSYDDQELWDQLERSTHHSSEGKANASSNA